MSTALVVNPLLGDLSSREFALHVEPRSPEASSSQKNVEVTLERPWKCLSPVEIAPLHKTRTITYKVPAFVGFDFVKRAQQLYLYRRLTKKDEIRLLNIEPAGSFEDPIRCSIFHTRLPQCLCVFEHIRPQKCPVCQYLPKIPKYEAISYTWGDPTTEQEISLNGKMLFVTTNCLQVLRRLRLSDQLRLVWIDAICIDQSTLQERNHQIRLMSRIYRAASNVVIYLGEGNEATDRVMEILRDEAGVNNIAQEDLDAITTLSPSADGLMRDLKSILAFLTLPWFGRIWVLQEVAWSWSATVVCGTKKIPWGGFCIAISSLFSGRGVDHQIPYVLSFRKDYLHFFEITARGFFGHLCRARHCASTDPRDKVFALLPLVSPFAPSPCTITVDYHEDVSDIYVRVASHLLDTVGIEVLSACQGQSLITNLPSWVPDWTVHPQRTVLGVMAPRLGFCAGGRPPDFCPSHSILARGTKAVLKIRGLRFDTIQTLEMGCDTYALTPAECQFIVFNQWYKAATGSEDFRTEPAGDTAASQLTRAREFWRTISVDAISSDENIDRSIFSARRAICETELDVWRAKTWPWMAGFGGLNLDKFLVPCDKRRFFITSRGFLGLAPPEAQVGDIVCVFLGARVPYILRKDEDFFKLVGECYVQLIMLGEAVHRFKRFWQRMLMPGLENFHII